MSNSPREAEGRCSVRLLGVLSSGGSRMVCPLGGGVSLLKGSHAWAAGARAKTSSNRYCKLRRTLGWLSLISSAVISGLKKGGDMVYLEGEWVTSKEK